MVHISTNFATAELEPKAPQFRQISSTTIQYDAADE